MRLIPAKIAGFNIQSRWLALLGIFAAGAILTTIAFFTVLNLVNTNQRLKDVTRTTALGDAYTNTTVSVALAQVAMDQFRLTGDPAERQKMLDAIDASFAGDARVKELGSDADRALLADIELRYGAGLAQGLQLLAGNQDAIGQSDPAILEDIASALKPAAANTRERAILQVDKLRSDFKKSSARVLVAIASSLPILGLLLLLIGRYERLDAAKAAELKRLGEAALTDSLTGLGNHRSFQEDLRHEMARASRSQAPVSIVMLDIDDFKEINDSQGHARGDAVLAEVGRLMAFLRGLDRPYRVGGDEFALIMPDTLAPEAHLVLDRLRQAVAEAIEGVTISVGISTSDRGDVPATRIRDQADTALYEAKHRGKNQVATYTLLLDDGGNFTAIKIQAIRQMLADSAVTMWFQPIFRVGSDKVLAFEALLRLPGSPEVSGPEEAFDIALQIGRSYELDLLCVRGALDVAQTLPADSKMFINLDPATLMHTDFSVAELVRLVEERAIDPTKVVFEVTEKTHVPLTRLAKQVEALHGCGFGVALDDVGAGNSGLEMLRLMTFDYVKIDQSVILDAMNGGPGRAIILAIVAFARETGAFMIAEGIESKAMLQAVKLDTRGLSEYWVQGVQGFLFGEPRPSVESYLIESAKMSVQPRPPSVPAEVGQAVDAYLNESPQIAEKPRPPSVPPEVDQPLPIGQRK